MTVKLESLARQAWQVWGDYAGYHQCGMCGFFTYCRRHRRSPWLCLDCFDQREV